MVVMDLSGLIVSIAKAMENRIAKKDRLTGVSPSSFRSLIKKSIEIETRNKITILEMRINENRDEENCKKRLPNCH
ncbi:hypothetical protein B566_EDAN013512 [Ephemera danica]|nr:hypothetical protein B566_EDAN013512 [Ephemera danica]